MKVSLISLSLTNFKGIKDYTLRLNGEDANIFGANATGKTTLFDAFTWLLFGADSNATASFSPKPFGADGQEVHNLETGVTAELIADNGKRIILSRTMTEDWVKQRGEAERTYKGNTYGYFINDVPSSQTDFNNYVKSIVSQDVFKMITNPMAFNALDWKKRRQMLLEISGANVDDALLALPKYKALASAMQERGLTIDEFRKATDAQRKRYNEVLERIPVQIAEVQRMDADVSETELEATMARSMTLMEEIAGIETQLSDTGAVLERYGRIINSITQGKKEMANIEREMTESANRARLEAQAKMMTLKQTLETLGKSREDKAEQIAKAKQDYTDCLTSMEELRKLWSETNAAQFGYTPDSTTCPTCGQELPAETLAAHMEEAQRAWQIRKDKALAEINADGQRKKTKSQEFLDRQDMLEKQTKELEMEIAKLKSELEAVTPVANAPAPQPNFQSSIKYAALAAQVAEQERNLENPDSEKERTAKLTADRDAKRIELTQCQAILAKREQHTRNAARIDELTKQQRETGELLADTEKTIILIEQFVTDRCKALEESINSLFPTVRWKLFDVQINTGIKDTCVCMIPNGPAGSAMVPFPDANNAAKVNAGLEIIDVLCGYYDVSVPVFVDNAESVNTLKTISGQRIALFVSNDPAMRTDTITKREVA